MASMSGLLGSSQGVLEGSFQLNGSTRMSLANPARINVARSGLTIRAQQGSSDSEVVAQSSRRSILGLVATGLATGSFVKAVLADGTAIKLGGPPPPFGGLPGTDNADEARDLDLPLKDRFFLQAPKNASEAVNRTKESAKEILNVKEFIDKKAWPYVQNDLRLRASYLRFDLKTIIASKPQKEKVALKELSGKLFQNLDKLDYAAKKKSPTEAAKYYGEAVTTLNDVLAKIG